MAAQQKEKGKLKSGKSESFSSQDLHAAHDAYDEEATLCVFRLKSLKQGQSRSLLTQAARHHAAQVLLEILEVKTQYHSSQNIDVRIPFFFLLLFFYFEFS